MPLSKKPVILSHLRGMRIAGREGVVIVLSRWQSFMVFSFILAFASADLRATDPSRAVPSQCFRFIQKVRVDVKGEGDARIFDRLAKALEQSSWEELILYLESVFQHDLFTEEGSFEKIVQAYVELIQDPHAPQHIRSRAFGQLIESLKSSDLGSRVRDQDLHPHLDALYASFRDLIEHEFKEDAFHFLTDEDLESLFDHVASELLTSESLHDWEALHLFGLLNTGLFRWKLERDPSEIQRWLETSTHRDSRATRARLVVSDMATDITEVLHVNNLNHASETPQLAQSFSEELRFFYFEALPQKKKDIDKHLDVLESGLARMREIMMTLHGVWPENSVLERYKIDVLIFDSSRSREQSASPHQDQRNLPEFATWHEKMRKRLQAGERSLAFFEKALEKLASRADQLSEGERQAFDFHYNKAIEVLANAEKIRKSLEISFIDIQSVNLSVVNSMLESDLFAAPFGSQLLDRQLVTLHLGAIAGFQVELLKNLEQLENADSFLDWWESKDSSVIVSLLEDNLEDDLFFLNGLFEDTSSSTLRAAILDHVMTWQAVLDSLEHKIRDVNEEDLGEEFADFEDLIYEANSSLELIPAFELEMYLLRPDWRAELDRHKVWLKQRGLSFSNLPIETKNELRRSSSLEELNRILSIYYRPQLPLLGDVLDYNAMKRLENSPVDDLSFRLEDLDVQLREVAQVEVKLLLNLKNNSLPVEVRIASLQPLFAIWSWRQEALDLQLQLGLYLEEIGYQQDLITLGPIRERVQAEQLHLLEFLLLGRVESASQLQQRTTLLQKLFAEVKAADGSLRKWLSNIPHSLLAELWEDGSEVHIEDYKSILDQLRLSRNQ